MPRAMLGHLRCMLPEGFHLEKNVALLYKLHQQASTVSRKLDSKQALWWLSIKTQLIATFLFSKEAAWSGFIPRKENKNKNQNSSNKQFALCKTWTLPISQLDGNFVSKWEETALTAVSATSKPQAILHGCYSHVKSATETNFTTFPGVTHTWSQQQKQTSPPFLFLFVTQVGLEPQGLPASASRVLKGL